MNSVSKIISIRLLSKITKKKMYTARAYASMPNVRCFLGVYSITFSNLTSGKSDIHYLYTWLDYEPQTVAPTDVHMINSTEYMHVLISTAPENLWLTAWTAPINAFVTACTQRKRLHSIYLMQSVKTEGHMVHIVQEQQREGVGKKRLYEKREREVDKLVKGKGEKGRDGGREREREREWASDYSPPLHGVQYDSHFHSLSIYCAPLKRNEPLVWRKMITIHDVFRGLGKTRLWAKGSDYASSQTRSIFAGLMAFNEFVAHRLRRLFPLVASKGLYYNVNKNYYRISKSTICPLPIMLLKFVLLMKSFGHPHSETNASRNLHYCNVSEQRM